jgi:hypothetical protein
MTLPYPILCRLSSPVKGGAAPLSAWLRAAPAGQRAHAVCMSYPLSPSALRWKAIASWTWWSQ